MTYFLNNKPLTDLYKKNLEFERPASVFISDSYWNDASQKKCSIKARRDPWKSPEPKNLEYCYSLEETLKIKDL